MNVSQFIKNHTTSTLLCPVLLYIAFSPLWKPTFCLIANYTPADLKMRTLTNLYNQRPAWLDLVRRKLDRAVFAADGWPADLSDDGILAALLALNHERAAANSAG